MRAKREFRDRDTTEVTVLDALVDRQDGMTVFELRSHAEVDIDELEDALSALKADDLIKTETDDGRTHILPDERVVPEPSEDEHEESFFDRLRERFGM
jgi:predicted transcriptional regulator